MVTYFQSGKILGDIFGGVAYTPPTTYYIGLSTTAPSADGTSYTEPASGAYARVQIANDGTTFSPPNNGMVTNVSQLQFNESTGSWGTVTHVLLFDSATDGNLLYYDVLPTPRTVETQTTLIFIPNAIEIRLI